MAAQKKSQDKSGSKTPRKPRKPLLPQKTKTDVELRQEEIDDLAEAFVESLSGRDAQISMNALASATATMCVTTDVSTDQFSAMTKAHVEANARELYKKKKRR